MQVPEGSASENAKPKARARSPEPLPPLVSAALEPGVPTLKARLERIETHSSSRTRYTVLGDLARGGMGRILRAWDEGLSREVAMKVVPRDVAPGSSDEERADHDRRLARFIDEARITGQLNHPGIVPVYEIGMNDAGEIFFTMPLVRGRNLKSVFASVHEGEEGWTLQRAVDVMHTVCLTVAFAHQKGVVHRDLKPENIMVGPFGEAYVMDWGLALLLGRKESGIMGTPAYMSPEQASGTGTQVGPRSDVYSLGAILYELFARRMPHEYSLETRATEHGAYESVLAAPPRPLSEIGSDVPPELAAVCAKAMAGNPDARYASALEMAEDLAAWLAGRTVSVLEQGRWRRLRKWRARNRPLAWALDALATLVVVGALAFSLQQRVWLREVRAKHAAMSASAYSASLSAADLGLRAHETGEARRRLDACDREPRGWEWRHLALRADASANVLEGHSGGVRAVSVSPDGSLIASGADDGTIRLWEAGGGPSTILEEHAGVVTAVIFAPDGKHLASASRDKRVLLWSLGRRALEREIATHSADVMALAFSGDGTVLASGDLSGGVTLSNVEDGRPLAERHPETSDGLAGLAFVPGSGLLATAYLSGFVRLLDPIGLEVRSEARVARIGLTCLDADPLGALLAVAFERTALVLDAAKLEPLRTITGHGSKVNGIAFSPDGAHLATASYDNELRVWELRSERPTEFEGHDSDVNCVAFFPDGQRLVTGAEDETLRLWDLTRTPVKALVELDGWVDALAFSPNGAQLLAGSHDRTLRLFDVGTGVELERADAEGIVDCVAWGPNDQLAFGSGALEARFGLAGRLGSWETLEAGRGFPKSMLFDPTGKHLFTRDSRGFIEVHELDRAKPPTILETNDDSHSLALSPDGRLLAAGTTSGTVRLWNAGTLEPLSTWSASDAAVTALRFSPDGSRLAVGCWNRAIQLLSTASGARERSLEGHEHLVSCLTFSPDGKRLVSGSNDHTLRVWNPETRDSLLTLRGHTAAVTAVSFDAGGEILASASKDGSLRLWRTARAFEVVAPGIPPK